MIVVAFLSLGFTNAVQATVLWTGEKVFTNYAGLEIEKEQFASVAAGDVITMTISACEATDAKFAFKQKDNGWKELTGFAWVDVTEACTYEYTVTETTATELATYGLVIQGNNITVTEVALVSATPAPTSFVVWTGENVAGNWSNAVQVSISDMSSAAIEDGDVLRIYVKDFDTASGTPSISLSYCDASWGWKDFTTSYQYYNPATTTAYVDYAITGELLQVLTATEGEQALLVRGAYYTATKVEIIKASGYYINLSDQYTALYIAGTADVNITRTLQAGYNTITLPFAATAAELTGSEDAYLAELSGVNTESGTVLTFTKVNATVANKPYLIYVAEDVDVVAQEDKEVVALVDDWNNQTWSGDFCMQGNYMPAFSVYQVNDKACYVVSGENSISPTGSSATLDGMRAYIFDNSGSEVKAITFVINDAPTGIKSLDQVSSTSAKKIYSLSGQQLAKPMKGINIVNGKKVIK